MTAAASPRVQAAASLALALARQTQRWALQRGAPAESARGAGAAARALSHAAGAGHVCLPLDELALSLGMAPDALAAALQTSQVVGSEAAPGSLPLILDDGGRLYLHRAFEHETALAARLRQRMRADPSSADTVLPDADEQIAAVEHALRRRLTIITGGPGSGKTSTVVRLLARLLQSGSAPRIALAAPTAKAASRMVEAIGRRARELAPELRERLPREASTLHRLLGYHPGRRGHAGFAYHAQSPLALDWLVVDEASMLDLALARHLFGALADTTQVVLLGDADQLAAVEAGAVFAELVALGEVDDGAGGHAQSVVCLQGSHRFAGASAIGRLAAAVRAGDAARLVSLLPPPHTLEELWTPYLDACRQGGAVASRSGELLAAFDRCRVLCAAREGPRGQRSINQQLDDRARACLAPGAPATSPWYPGRPVLVLHNQPELKVFNGDTGITCRQPDGSLALHIAGRSGLPPLAPARIAEHQSAWAMTVHKAQGSEFDEVLLVLPEPPSPLLTRELLYTALTRARQRASVVGSPASLQAAAQTPTRRAGALALRIARTPAGSR